ncbi:MAG: acetylxylan esterase, partial [Acidobacteria bacterium]|nr:acetylxylan esterase [Acidobacteriota bacterium]
QDAEQCIPPWIGDGLDHPDFLYAVAPKPYLMLSAIRDFFSITGARETYEEAKRVYALLGVPEKLRMVEADDGHGYSLPRRMAAYNWFGRWLKGAEDNEPEAPVEPETEEALWATNTGQVATSLGGETVHSLNLKRVEQARAMRKYSADEVRRLTGFKPPDHPLKITPYGQIARNGYRIEKLTYETEPGILVPSLLYVPDSPAGPKPAVIYVNSRGKSAGNKELEQLAHAGYVALAIDIRGTGETRFTSDAQGSDFPRFFGDYNNAMKALLLGKTLAGMRAQDIARGLDLLATRPEVDRDRILGYGRGGGAVPLLHLAALDPRLKRVALEEMLVSYEAVVRARIHRDVFESVVPGALRSYDLPDLAAAAAPRRVTIVSSIDPLGHPLPGGGRKAGQGLDAILK